MYAKIMLLVSSLAFYSLRSSGTTAHVLKGSLCFLTLTAWTLIDFYNKAAINKAQALSIC